MTSRLKLINSRTSLDEFDLFMNASALEAETSADKIHSVNLGRKQAVYAWIRPTDMENDQGYLRRIRVAYPSTCNWLLDETTFQEWFDPQSNVVTLPKLLWLNGKPGSGEFLHACIEQQLTLWL